MRSSHCKVYGPSRKSQVDPVGETPLCTWATYPGGTPGSKKAFFKYAFSKGINSYHLFQFLYINLWLHLEPSVKVPSETAWSRSTENTFYGVMDPYCTLSGSWIQFLWLLARTNPEGSKHSCFNYKGLPWFDLDFIPWCLTELNSSLGLRFNVPKYKFYFLLGFSSSKNVAFYWYVASLHIAKTFFLSFKRVHQEQMLLDRTSAF